MTNDYKVQPVSVGQLFLLLFMGRALICLTYIPTLRFGHINGDYLVSILLSVPMLLVLYFCVHRYLKLNHTENLLDVTGARTKLGAKVLAALYFGWFVYNAGKTVARFVYFVTLEMSPNMPIIFFSAIIVVAACYGSYIGVQALGRVAGLVTVLLVLGFFIIIVFSLEHFDIYNFSPIFNQGFDETVNDAFLLTSYTIETTILLFVTPKKTEKTERYMGRYYALWVFGTVGFNFIVYFFAIASMGEYLQTQAFPIFAYSQLADLGPIERLDSIHTSIWLIAVFLKTALLLVCADKCLKFLLPRTNRAAVSAGSAGITLAISLFIANSFENYINTSQRWLTITAYVFFAVAIPLVCSLAFIRGRNHVKGGAD